MSAPTPTDRIELTDEEIRALWDAITLGDEGDDVDRAVESIIADRVSAAKTETREQVAQDIEAFAKTATMPGVLRRAARIARGAEQTEPIDVGSSACCAHVGPLRQRVDQLRDDIARLTRERNEWEANEQQQSDRADRAEAALADIRTSDGYDRDVTISASRYHDDACKYQHRIAALETGIGKLADTLWDRYEASDYSEIMATGDIVPDLRALLPKDAS